MSYRDTNPFTLGQVLSITHGVLMCDISGCYAILNHMTGQSLYTHQLPLAAEAAKPVLCTAFPALATVDLTHVGTHNWQEVLEDLKATHGDSFDCPVLTDRTSEDTLRTPLT